LQVAEWRRERVPVQFAVAGVEKKDEAMMLATKF
jgi:hypothetical protein